MLLRHTIYVYWILFGSYYLDLLNGIARSFFWPRSTMKILLRH